MIIVKGQTEKHEFTVTNENGAVDLTGSTVKFLITDTIRGVIYEQEKTTFDAPTSGIFVITIPKETTALFSVGSIKSQIDILNTSSERDYSQIYSGAIKDHL